MNWICPRFASILRIGHYILSWDERKYCIHDTVVCSIGLAPVFFFSVCFLLVFYRYSCGCTRMVTVYCSVVNFTAMSDYEMRKSNAFSLLLSNFSSASDILFSSKPRSSSSLNGIKCSTICNWKVNVNENLKWILHSLAIYLFIVSAKFLGYPSNTLQRKSHRTNICGQCLRGLW